MLINKQREEVKAALSYEPTDEEYNTVHVNLTYYGFILIGIILTSIFSGIFESVFWSNVVIVAGAFFTISIAGFVRELMNPQFLKDD